MSRKFRIFADHRLGEYLGRQLASAIAEIEQSDDSYLLNVSIEEYVKYLVSAATATPIEFHTDQLTVSSEERMIPAELFPRTFDVYNGQSYKKDVIIFHLPFSGDPEILRCFPNQRLIWTTEVSIEGKEITFETINFRNSPEEISRSKNETIKNLKQQSNNLNAEIERYNRNIESEIKLALENRRKIIISKTNLLSSLGIPLKKAANVPSTFSIPTPATRKRVQITKPQVSMKPENLDPTLAEGVYFDILKMIHDVGKEFERLPSLYSKKEEEHLRDHFLMMLEPQFEGSATGETFNKTGKTDILLRFEGSNVFIAECKFWHGEKAFLQTISQLLSYLTWRDSKAAVIVFVQNKNFTSVIQTGMSAVLTHPNFVRKVCAKDETWEDFCFHLNEDSERIVRVAVMFYHIPRIGS